MEEVAVQLGGAGMSAAPTIQVAAPCGTNLISDPSSLAVANEFFSYPIEAPSDIVSGIISERQIGYLAADWCLGKTPVFQQLALCVAKGIPFLGQETAQRPVVILDAETPYEDYRPSVERIAKRLGVAVDDVNLHPFLRHGHEHDPNSKDFRIVIGNQAKVETFLRDQLAKYHNALVLIDPLLEIVPYKENEAESAMKVYNVLRSILGDYADAAFLFTLHLRKGYAAPDAKSSSSWHTLLNNPREWFKEVAGTNKLGAHADVRLGMTATSSSEAQMIINGFKRGKEAAFLCFEKAVDDRGEYDGFTVSALPDNAKVKLSSQQETEISKLPPKFRFSEVADKGIPHSSLARLLKAGQKAGRAFKDADGFWSISGTPAARD
jgi:hypothetical protein